MNLHHDRIQTTAMILRPKAEAFLERTAKAGYRILVVRAWESTDAQWLKYQQGRELDRATGTWEPSEPNRIITYALPGQSGHNLIDQEGHPASTAIDIIPVDPDGTPLWGLPGETAEQFEARWQKATGRSQETAWAHLYQIGGKCGLDAYGDDWGAVLKKDRGHFEEPAYGLILKALQLRQPAWAMPAGI